MQITLREYQKQDFQVLENIIRETWHFDEFSSPKTAKKLARVYLSSCLANQTFSCVALENDMPVGIILVKNIEKYKCPLKFKLQQIRATISLLVSAEGRKVSKIFGNVSGIDKDLLKECGKSYTAEIALFAVASDCRGKGIGKALFETAIKYMNEERANDFYLFTDTSCNYQFYEYQGMIRRCEKEHTYCINEREAKMNFFLYDYQIQ